MSLEEKDKNDFFKAVESLKKYRRADVIDDDGKSILEKLYVDLLPSEYVLKKALLENTTFFIGRKGTGKSTIFLRLEQELRKKSNYLSCYLDVKTIYEKSQTQHSSLEKIKDLVPEELLSKYLIERTFIQNTLEAIRQELDNKYNSLLNDVANHFVTTKPEAVKERIDDLQAKIAGNETIESIEIPILKGVYTKHHQAQEEKSKKNFKAGIHDPSLNLNPEGAEIKTGIDVGISKDSENTKLNEIENEFSSVFLQVFQIKEIISEIKSILKILKIDHLYILLDDFSEIDDHAIKRFVDVLLAPLNNWSDEFVKFKVAAYPGRIYYGKIDPGKVDTMYLDFYNLYSGVDRDKMEANSTDFAKRLVENRIQYFTNLELKDFFDTDSLTEEEYYHLFFKVSMNVPRILGYILSFCYESKIAYGKKITKTDIESAAQKYYEDKIESFFDTTTYSLLGINEKVSILQLRDLLEKISDRLETNKKRIQSQDLKGSSYIAKMPYSSHFYISADLEKFLETLELNFFVSKYNEMSDKDGVTSSVFCINYGLAKKLNLLWGKPDGNQYRKYFTQRPFNFNPAVKEFLNESESIKCTNSECNKEFGVDDLSNLEFNNFKCNECGSLVERKKISQSIVKKIKSISSDKLLPVPEIKIIQELSNSSEAMSARELAQAIDYSGQLIGWRGKKLDEDHGYVSRFREKENSSYKYQLTPSGETYFD